MCGNRPSFFAKKVKLRHGARNLTGHPREKNLKLEQKISMKVFRFMSSKSGSRNKWTITPLEEKSDSLSGKWTKSSDSSSDDENMSHLLPDPFFDFQFRVILIGDSTVGKSSLLKSFTDGTFAEVSDPTVGVDFFARVLKVANGTPIKLQLWDTAGQERFRSITKSYYRNSVGCLLVFDICNRDSYKHIPQWMSEAKRHIEPHKAAFILVGCKKDIASEAAENREVSEEEARAWAQSQNIQYIETSAKSRWNVEETFACLSQLIYDRIQTGEYKLDDGWDGIKRGYYGVLGSSVVNNNNNSVNNSVPDRSIRLLEGQPERRLCC